MSKFLNSVLLIFIGILVGLYLEDLANPHKIGVINAHEKTLQGKYPVGDICFTWGTDSVETTCIEAPAGMTIVRVYVKVAP